ncbi:MAG: ABC transporter permease [Nitrospinota bacterium]|nr:ABC transporter permease [Nitrospinota bacterium]
MEKINFFDDRLPGRRLMTYLRFLMFIPGHLHAFGRKPGRQVLMRQIYFTTVEQLRRITAVAAVTGMVVITQISQALGYDPALIGKALLWLAVRELGPLITAILVMSSSGAAITSELASMKINREFDALRTMGIDPMEYLVLPRMISAIASVLLLNVYFQAAAILGGGALASLWSGISFQQHVLSVFSALTVFDMSLSMAKSLVFGMAVAAVACSHGALVGQSITDIPRAIIGAQMRALFIFFLSDGLISYMAL